MKELSAKLEKLELKSGNKGGICVSPYTEPVVEANLNGPRIITLIQVNNSQLLIIFSFIY